VAESPDDFTRGLRGVLGWGVVATSAEVTGGQLLGFAYTVGLETTYDHPELFITGVNPARGLSILNAVGARISGGDRITDGVALDGVVVGYAVVPRTMRRWAVAEYLRIATPAQVLDHAVRGLHLVWPDPAHRLPWDADFTASMRIMQPATWETRRAE
jgi:hypothetical protein